MIGVTAGGDEGVGVGWQDAGFLRLLAGVDLDETGRAAVLFIHFTGQSGGQFGAVDGLHGVEKAHRVARLVGLQGADQMQFEIFDLGLERGPAGERLLHPIFAKQAVAGGDGGGDAVGRLHLADGDQAGGRRVAAGGAGGGGDPRRDGGQVAGDFAFHIGHFGPPPGYRALLLTLSGGGIQAGAAASALARAWQRPARSPRPAQMWQKASPFRSSGQDPPQPPRLCHLGYRCPHIGNRHRL